jgi:hypothetical protein
MTSPDDKLTRLVAELRKAVIGVELHRGRAERPRPRAARAASRTRAA